MLNVTIVWSNLHLYECRWFIDPFIVEIYFILIGIIIVVKVH